MAVKAKNKTYLQILSAIGLFTLAAWGASSHRLPVWEKDLFLSIYNWPVELHRVFYALTQAGSVGALLGVGLAFFMRRRHFFALKIYTNGAMAYMLVTVMKQAFVRARPDLLLEGVTKYDPLANGYGFPSGHTAVSAAMAFSLWPLLPRPYRPLILIWPLAVGLSRVNLGVHAPLDTLGGFAIGWAVVAFNSLWLKRRNLER